MLHRLTSEDTRTMDCVDMAEADVRDVGEREDPGAGFGGPFIPLFLTGNRRRIFPLTPKPQKGPHFLCFLLFLTCPCAPPTPQYPS